MGFYRASFAIGQCESADALDSISGRILAIQYNTVHNMHPLLMSQSPPLVYYEPLLMLL